ncbi:hypothetical protein KJY77_01085 [Canibacter sp. lx-72]|uniref:Rv3235 family protein n=1 Tax=Canibacter zhuwentaonis TaxID=2837491 RepID=UPI001BDCD5B5|nr:Rv3235 family protein [Canibacter zhuwentaonis]MBT1017737.1 hypothetical protein [Canibacter zhuwentaonis]
MLATQQQLSKTAQASAAQTSIAVTAARTTHEMQGHNHKADLPDPLLVRNIALCAAEIVFCNRPLTKINAFINNSVAQTLRLQQRIAKSAGVQSAKVTWLSNRSLAHLYRVNSETVDCVVMLLRDKIAFAVALRMQRAGIRWRVIELTII